MRVEVYADDADRRRRVISTDRRIDGEPQVHFVDSGIILPLRVGRARQQVWRGGVLDRDGEFVAGHRYHPTRENSRNIVAGYPVPGNIRHVAETVFYAGGSGSKHFGHFLTETLSRLWWLIDNPQTSMRVVLNTQGIDKDHHLVQFLVHLGVNADQLIFLTEPTRFDAVIVPDQAFFLGSGNYYPGALKRIFDTIRDSVTPGGVDKIYLTRTGFREQNTKLREINEEMFEDFFRTQGYEVVASETLPLSEQISLVAGATRLASTAGSLSHLVLFSPDDVRQDILLRSSRSFMLSGQWGMSQARASSLSVVDATLKLLPSFHWSGVVAYTSSVHWLDFALREYGEVVAPDSSHQQVPELLESWTSLLANATSRELEMYPAWTMTDFIASFHQYFTGESLNPDARYRLTERFGSHYASVATSEVIVDFETHGGTLVESQKVALGSRLKKPTSPTREGAVFAGWHTSPRLKTRFDFDLPVTRNKTVHAGWVQLPGNSREP